MTSNIGISCLFTQNRTSLISEQKSTHAIFTEKEATKEGNISTAINISNFWFLFTIIGSLLASTGIFATKKKRTTTFTSCSCAGNFSNVLIGLEFLPKACS